MKKTVSIAAAIFLLIGQQAFAQEELTLSEAVNYALEHKAEARKSRLDIENSEYKIAEVRANALPQINGQSSLTYNAKLQQMAMDFGGQVQVFRMGTPWQANSAIQLDQQIFNLQVFQGLKAANSTRDFYIINNELTEEQIVEKVANSYYEVYKSKSQIQTMNSTIENTTRVKDVIQSLFENGLAKKIDLDRINVSLNNLKSSKQQLINAQALQENSLKYLIGMEIQKEITMPEGTFEIDRYIDVNRGAGVDHRTEIRLMEMQGELLRLNKKAIEASRYPSLSLSANYGYLSMGDRFPYFAGPSKGVNGSDFSAISLNLRVPIFTGFSNRAKINQAQIEIDKLEVDLHDTKLALNLAMENAHTQITNSLITLNTQKSNMELAKDVLSNVENNYKNGLATLTDLLDAETSHADARNNYTNALLDYKLAEVQLIKSKGELKSYYSQSK